MASRNIEPSSKPRSLRAFLACRNRNAFFGVRCYNPSPRFLPNSHSMPPPLTLDAANKLADAIFENGLPRHQPKAKSIFHHGKPAASERGNSGKTAADIFARFVRVNVSPRSVAS